ncbi:MAG: hypothetical protein ACC682_09565 [Gemmatimonadota bacterium]
MKRLFTYVRTIAPMLALVVSACGGADQDAADTPGAETDPPTATPPDAAESAVVKWGDGLLNPNLAGEDEIAGLDGITDGAVAAIMDARPFMDMVALDGAISSDMDEAAREALYGSMWIPLDLNAASEEELLLIPGVGTRMAGEFDEYRPYDGIPRFRREMGKYVDEDVVETYTKYVFITIDLNSATREQIMMIPGVGSRLLGEIEEYRPYESIDQFMREIGKYVDDSELVRLARYVTLGSN